MSRDSLGPFISALLRCRRSSGGIDLSTICSAARSARSEAIWAFRLLADYAQRACGPSLTHENLKELGVASLGHRRKLLDAIAALRTDASGKAPSANVATASSAPSVSPFARAKPPLLSKLDLGKSPNVVLAY